MNRLEVRNLPTLQRFWFEMFLCVEEVGIHQAGKQQACSEGFGKRFPGGSRRDVRQTKIIPLQPTQQLSHGLWTPAKAFPLLIRPHSANGLFQTITVPRRHAGVVTVHGKGSVVEAQLGGARGSGCPVVNAVDGRIPEPCLKPLGIFPKVMQ